MFNVPCAKLNGLLPILSGILEGKALGSPLKSGGMRLGIGRDTGYMDGRAIENEEEEDDIYPNGSVAPVGWENEVTGELPLEPSTGVVAEVSPLVDLLIEEPEVEEVPWADEVADPPEC